MLGLGGRRRSGALISMATAKSGGRPLGGAAATADWSGKGAESVNCLWLRGRSSWIDRRCPAPWTPWTPTPAPVSGPSLLLPIPAIVVLSVGIYLLLLGLVLLTRHCLLAQGCCTDCSSPCRKQGASRPQDCCQTCAEACDFPLPSPARYLDACCPQPAEAGCGASKPGDLQGLILPSFCQSQDRTGPLAALAAARSATVPVRANFLTARASTASALRSSSDDDPSGSLLFGERPAPRAHRPCSLRGLRTPFSRPVEPQMACPAHRPGNRQWRAWLPAERDSQSPWPAGRQPLSRARRERGWCSGRSPCPCLPLPK